MAKSSLALELSDVHSIEALYLSLSFTHTHFLSGNALDDGGGKKKRNRYHMGRLKASGIWAHLDKNKYYGRTAVSFAGLRKELAA